MTMMKDQQRQEAAGQWMQGLESKIKALEDKCGKRSNQERRRKTKQQQARMSRSKHVEIQNIVDDLKIIAATAKGKSKAGRDSSTYTSSSPYYPSCDDEDESLCDTLPTVSLRSSVSADYSILTNSSHSFAPAESEMRVSFLQNPITEIWTRPRTDEADISELYYSVEDTKRFREQYRLESEAMNNLDNIKLDASLKVKKGDALLSPITQPERPTGSPPRRPSKPQQDNYMPSLVSPRPARLVNKKKQEQSSSLSSSSSSSETTRKKKKKMGVKLPNLFSPRSNRSKVSTKASKKSSYGNDEGDIPSKMCMGMDKIPLLFSPSPNQKESVETPLDLFSPQSVLDVFHIKPEEEEEKKQCPKPSPVRGYIPRITNFRALPPEAKFSLSDDEEDLEESIDNWPYEFFDEEGNEEEVKTGEKVNSSEKELPLRGVLPREELHET